jgi:hypothetical protein
MIILKSELKSHNQALCIIVIILISLASQFLPFFWLDRRILGQKDRKDRCLSFVKGLYA